MGTGASSPQRFTASWQNTSKLASPRLTLRCALAPRYPRRRVRFRENADFDSQDIYGPSESVLGSFREKNPDKSFQVFTKCVPNIFREKPTRASIEAGISRSCAALKQQKLDLVQLHWWDYSVPGMVDVALTLTELAKGGRITSVGVTNMDTEALAKLVDAGVPVVCNQVQLSLLDRRPLNGMVQYCANHNIKLLTYGTLAGGLLSERYVAEPKAGLPFVGPRYPPVDLNTSSLKMYSRNISDQVRRVSYRADEPAATPQAAWLRSLSRPRMSRRRAGARFCAACKPSLASTASALPLLRCDGPWTRGLCIRSLECATRHTSSTTLLLSLWCLMRATAPPSTRRCAAVQDLPVTATAWSVLSTLVFRT